MMRYLLILLMASSALVAAPAPAPARAPEPKFRRQVIDDKIQIGYGVVAADVDGDKKTDILLADKRQFVWYRNPTWEKFVIAENLTKRDNVCLAAQDLDGDGKCELAVGADWDPNDRENSGAVFYLIPPEDRTKKWEPVRLHAEPTVHRMRWLPLEESGWGLVVAPLHGRGKDSNAGSRILLYHKPANPRDEWKTTLLDDSMHLTHCIHVMRPSAILVAGQEGVLDIQTNRPRPKVKVPGSAAAGEVRNTANYLATIEPMHGNKLVVRTQSGDYVLTDKMIEGHALGWDDLLGWDYFPVVVGWRGGGGGVRMFTPLNREHSQWRESVIDDKGMACEDLCVSDLDGDRKPDLVASGRATHNVVIYWNETPGTWRAPETSR